jgi:tRNA threonylcarbamoyladenosine biosynthesis protein TsaB
MKLLAIETSTQTASVAVLHGDQIAAFCATSVDTRSENVISLIDGALSQAGITLADVDGIAVGLGPGSFTGLRIAMATAKGLCFAAGKSLYGVSSLAALALDGARAARETARDALLVPVTDARRGEVFAGFYCLSDAKMYLLAPEEVVPSAQLAARISAVRAAHPELVVVALCGDGIETYPLLRTCGALLEGAPSVPSATAVAFLACHERPLDLTTATPTYIRPSEAEVKFSLGNPGGLRR